MQSFNEYFREVSEDNQVKSGVIISHVELLPPT